MSMPKGHKSKHGYATVSGDDGGMDYRRIAEKMTEDGYKMNHATARNVFLSAMRKLATPVYQMYAEDYSLELVDKAARDPRFQAGVFEVVSEIYK
ncbi:MAG TPA: hypothetical protein EYG51_16795 [Pseudomonadales bacterium]|nr:hypothetical protein [Pseudomonadales bacterium]